ncbi:MAG: beta-lactamase hydrolase domain-containing protein [Alphaproteobacteria bacterium]
MKLLIKIVFIIAIFGSASWSLAWAGDRAAEDLDMRNARQPMATLTTGGQPTKGDLGRFAERGVELIINLRVPGEFNDFNEAELVQVLGMRYLNIPVTGMGNLTPENARLLHDALESTDGAVVLHCASGRRAGALLGVEGYLFHELSKEAAIELGIRANLDHVAGAIEDSIEKFKKE